MFLFNHDALYSARYFFRILRCDACALYPFPRRRARSFGLPGPYCAFRHGPQTISTPLLTPPYGVRAGSACSAYAERHRGRFDRSYHLDAGDRLRVVVYGQEGLTTPFDRRLRAITLPLIGLRCPRAAATPAGLVAGNRAKRATVSSAARGRGGNRAYQPFFILGESIPRPIPYVPNMSGVDPSPSPAASRRASRRYRVTVTHTDASVPGRFGYRWAPL